VLARASLCALLLAAAWYVTALRPFSIAATVAVVGSGAVAITIGLTGVRHPQRRTDRVIPVRGMAVWLALASVIVAFELAQFAQHPRAAHPTLSSIVNTLLDAHVARTVAFAAWLVTAAMLAAR
jgi:hypothetical protein